jgi:hypothetical protein
MTKEIWLWCTARRDKIKTTACSMIWQSKHVNEYVKVFLVTHALICMVEDVCAKKSRRYGL